MFSVKLNEVNQIFMNVDKNKAINMSEKTRKYMEYHRENILV